MGSADLGGENPEEPHEDRPAVHLRHRLLSARASGADLRVGQPVTTRAPVDGRDHRGLRPRGRPHPGLAQDLCSGFARIRATGMPVVVLGGEQQPSAELMELSSVPMGVAAEAPPLPRRGRPGQPGPAARVPLRHGPADRRGGSRAPVAIPAWGVLSGPRWSRRARPTRPARPTQPSRASACCSTAPTRRAGTTVRPRPGRRDRRDRVAPSACRSSPRACAPRPASTSCTPSWAPSTPWSSPCWPARRDHPERGSAGGDDEAWDVRRMAALDIPVIQACA